MRRLGDLRAPAVDTRRPEFREFLTCGVLAHGFTRLRCADCTFERLLPFSCKRRGFCPSCGGRRMAEHAASLVDEVLPRVPVRQWVLTLPYRLRYRLAWDHALCRAVLSVYVRTLLASYARTARSHGIQDGRTGTVTAIQRFGSGLRLNVYFHTLVLDGVFSHTRSGPLTFHPAPPPRDADVAHLLAIVRARVGRLLARRHLEPAERHGRGGPAGRSLASPGRPRRGLRPGPRRPRPPRRRPRPPPRQRAGPRSRHLPRPRQAQLDGFDLHANVWVPPNNRARLEHLCRYFLRSPLAQDRLRLRADGRVLVELKTVWRDGTSHFLFEPIEFLEKLAALVPRPAVNLLVYHGVLAPRARWRSQVVRYARPAPDGIALTLEATPRHAGLTHAWTWAALMRRVFDHPLNCTAHPRCGGTGAGHTPVPSSLRAGASGGPPPPAGASGSRFFL